MRIRKIFIAVSMTALCLLGTMPLSVSAYKTLFVFGELYQYNDVKYIQSPIITSDDEIFPIEVEGVIQPIDLSLIDENGIKIGSIDIISANIDSILGGRVEQTVSEDGVDVTQHLYLLEIYCVGDILIYSPTLGYNIPKYFTQTSFRFSIAYQELTIDVDGEINIQTDNLNVFTFYDGTFNVETLIDKPSLQIAIYNIINYTPENELLIVKIMSAFTPSQPFTTQLKYTTNGFSTMASNAITFIREYAIIDNPIINISLIIMAFVLCLIILKFIFIRR